MKSFTIAAVLGTLLVIPALAAPTKPTTPATPAAPTLIHRYSFNGNANDSVGTANGTVVGNVTFQTDPTGTGPNGNAVFGGGTAGSGPSYISLPPSAVSGLTNATIEIFTTNFNMPNDQTNVSNGQFQPLFAAASAYGNTSNYIVLSPDRSGAGIGVAGRANNAGEIATAANDPLPCYVQNHVVTLVFSGFSGVGSTGVEAIYLDGRPVAVGQTAYSFAKLAAAPGGIATVGIGGGSPFNDPTYSGSIDEVRIFSGALPPAQIAADVTAGPAALGFYVSNPIITSLTSSSALVTWTSGGPADATVNYGTSSAYGSTATGPAGVTSHSVTLTGLTLGDVYHYSVASTTAAGQTASSPDSVFVFQSPPLAITGIAVGPVGPNSATVTWATNYPADGTVTYGTTSSSGSTATGAAGVTSHSVVLSGLRPGVTYFYHISSKGVVDGKTQTASGQDGSFTAAQTTGVRLSVTQSGTTYNSVSKDWAVTLLVSDTGTAAAQGVQLKFALMGSTPCLDILPMALGTLPVGGSKSVTLHFPSSASGSLSWGGLFSGGSFSSMNGLNSPN